MVLGLSVLKLNSIDRGWTDAPMWINFRWISPWSMFEQLGTEGTWCQSNHVGASTC